MGDVCRLSWQPSERGAFRRVFFLLLLFSPSSGSWREIVCLSGLSVWKMRDISTSVCRTRRVYTRLCWQQPGRQCSQVLWEEAFLGHAHFFLIDCYLGWMYSLNCQCRIGRTWQSVTLLSSVWHHWVRLRRLMEYCVFARLHTWGCCRSALWTWLLHRRSGSSRTTVTRLTTGH